jgi:hypothetical protein
MNITDNFKLDYQLHFKIQAKTQAAHEVLYNLVSFKRIEEINELLSYQGGCNDFIKNLL